MFSQQSVLVSLLHYNMLFIIMSSLFSLNVQLSWHIKFRMQDLTF